MVSKSIELLLNWYPCCRNANKAFVRRQSMIFESSPHWPPHCHQDLARHRTFHHYYEDLLS